jgi:hypothetical protein
MMVNRERYRRDRRSLVRLAAVLIVAVALSPVVGHGTAAPAPATEAAWDALRAGGTVALIRHALAPGTGDPPGFALGDCATQRNLSDEGRAQAARLGEAEVWPPLHSFFGDPGTEPARTAEARAGVASWTGPGTLVLVTHQVNITALTGIVPESGEVIALVPAPDQPAGFVVAGRITVR